MSQINIEQSFQIAVRHHQAGRLQQAEPLYRQILAEQPKHFGALHFLGVMAHQQGRNDVAVDLIRQALLIQPGNADAYGNLGVALKANGQLDEAIAAYHQAIALRPSYPAAFYNLGIALGTKGQLDEAIAAYRQAIAQRPDYAEAYNNLGNALNEKGQVDEAVAACRAAIAIRPNYPEAYNNLGNALRSKRRPEEAIGAFRQAIALKPDFAEAHNNLGNALKDNGQMDEAIAAYRQAIVLRPEFHDAHSNLVYAMMYHPGYDARAIAQEAACWNRRYAEPVREFIQPHRNDRSPDRRLRIGYVSPDLREHPLGRLLLPLLANHDKSQFELFAYSHVVVPDAMTGRLRSYVDHWRNTVGLSDIQTCDLIRGDQIDVLVDLTMHMSHSRLMVFARKPAPVQVAYLAYPGTSGLATIDYRITDPYLDPPGSGDSDYSEQSVRLPETYWCYGEGEEDIEAGPLPADSAGYVTFGCLNNFCKINERVLSLWATVMSSVSNSRLLLLAPVSDARPTVRERLERLGVKAERVEFVAPVPHRQYLRNYQRIDIGLDTFPYNGHTTSLDSFWMGVPVVTRVGRTAVGRAGRSQLSNLNLTELAADDDDQFVSIASELAGDRPRLSALRLNLRERMRASALMDGGRFARNMEAAYRQMWRTWCAGADQQS
jgi:predicted O-linked N-acetylglucosamine transferase (SPINDLY family)